MIEKELTWETAKESLAFTPEERAEIQLEIDLIEATIEARKKCSLTQRELSKKSGLTQPAIARIESRAHSPKVDTLMHLLFSMGYTLRVVPLSENE